MFQRWELCLVPGANCWEVDLRPETQPAEVVDASSGVSLPRHGAYGLLRFCSKSGFVHCMALLPLKALPLAGAKATSVQSENQGSQKRVASASTCKKVRVSAGAEALTRASQQSGSFSADREALWSIEIFVWVPSHLVHNMIPSIQIQGKHIRVTGRSKSSLHEQAFRIHKQLRLEHKEGKGLAPTNTQPTGTRHQRNQKLMAQ